MKTILFALSILLTANAYAVDLGTIDPTIAGNENLTLICDKPLQYEDNTDIAIGEVVEVQWKVSVNGAVFVNAGNKVTSCQQIIDLTQVADSDYVYKATAWARAKESVLSTDFLSITVKRLPNPKTVTGISGSTSGSTSPAAGSL